MARGVGRRSLGADRPGDIDWPGDIDLLGGFVARSGLVTLFHGDGLGEDEAMTVQRSSDPEAIGPQTSVQALMTRAVARIDPEARLFEVAQKLASVEAGALAVGTTDAVIGMVSERDVTRAYGRNDHPDAIAAGDIASTDVLWCLPEVSAAAAAQSMCDQGVRHLLVGDAASGDLQGIVSARDLIEALIGS